VTIQNTNCDIHGPFVTETRFDLLAGCPKCRDERLEGADREHAFSEARRRLDSTCVPLRFREKTLESFKAYTPAQENVLGVARDYVYRFPVHYGDGRCLVLSGNIGTGKTLLASAIIQSLINVEFFSRKQAHSTIIYRAKYTTATEIIRRIRDTWGTKTSTTTVMEGFANVDLLIIDEIGAQTGTDNERALLFELIDLRYQTALPTVVITNCDREGLTKALGERAVDRLRDNGGLLCIFDWESWRK
jgi:DNA replication protein DnaC